MAIKTLFFRVTQSLVVSGTATVKSLSETPGNATHNNTGTVHNSNVKNGTNTTTDMQVVPLQTGVTAAIPTSVPNSKGWIFDTAGSDAGTYDAGTWQFNVQTQYETTALPDVNVVAVMYVVTATSTAVTKVSQPIVLSRSATAVDIPTTPGTRISWTATGVPSITLASGEYLYFEFAYRGVSGGVNNRHYTLISETGPLSGDSGSANNYGSIVTPNFGTGGGGGVAVDLSGSCSATFTSSGVVSVTKPLSGSTTVTTVASASASVAKPLTGSASIVTSATGDVTTGAGGVAVALSGACSITTTVSGSATKHVPIVGANAFAFSAAGVISKALNLAGSTGIAFSSSGALAGPAPTVQVVNSSTHQSPSANPYVITHTFTPATATAGNCLLLTISMSGAADNEITGITDDKSNTWGRVDAHFANGRTVEIWAAPNCNAGAPAITVNTTNYVGRYYTYREVSGLATTSPADVTNVGSNAAATSHTTAATANTSQADEFVLVAFVTDVHNAVYSITSGSNYTGLLSISPATVEAYTSGGSAYKIVSAIGAQTGAITTNVAANSASIVATFKVGVAAVPNTPTKIRIFKTNGGAKLLWESNGTGHKIYQSTTLNGTYTQVSGNPTTGAFTVTGLTNSQEYFFKIIATNSVGDSALSAAVRTIPTADIGNAEFISSLYEWNKRYVRFDGAIVRPPADGINGSYQSGYEDVVSEGQAYILDYSVQNNDKALFDLSEAWAYANLDRRNNGSLTTYLNLMGWHYDSANNVMYDWNSAHDADVDRMKALYYAHNRWGSAGTINYKARADAISDDLLSLMRLNSVTGKWHMPSDAVQSQNTPYEFNMSYFDPVACRVAAVNQTDTTKRDKWLSAVDGDYALSQKVLDYIFTPHTTTAKIPADWAYFNPTTNAVSPAQRNGASINNANFGFDAFRFLYRIYQDWVAYSEPRAKTVTADYKAFVAAKWAALSSVKAVWAHDGTLVGDYQLALFDYAAYLALILDDAGNTTAASIKTARIDPLYYSAGGFYAATAGDTANSYFGLSWAISGEMRRQAIYTNYIPAGVAVALSGSCTISVAASGSTSVTKSLSGSTSISTISNGSASVTKSMSGATTMALASNGNVSLAKSLSGATSIAFASTGSFTGSVSLSGSCTITTSASGNFNQTLRFAGSSTISTISNGSVGLAKSLSGATSVTTISNGSVGLTKSMGGSSSVSFVSASNLALAKSLGGSAAIAFVSAGGFVGTVSLSGSCAIALTTSGSFNQNLRFGGNTTISTITNGSVNLTKSMAGSSSLSLVSAGNATANFALSSSAAITLSASGGLLTTSTLSGNCSMTVTSNGSVNLVKSMSGASALVLGTTSNLSLAKLLSGSSAVAFTSSGGFLGSVSLSGSCGIAFVTTGSFRQSLRFAGTSSISTISNGSMDLVKRFGSSTSITTTSTGSTSLAKNLAGSSAITTNVGAALTVVINHHLSGAVTIEFVIDSAGVTLGKLLTGAVAITTSVAANLTTYETIFKLLLSSTGRVSTQWSADEIDSLWKARKTVSKWAADEVETVWDAENLMSDWNGELIHD